MFRLSTLYFTTVYWSLTTQIKQWKRNVFGWAGVCREGWKPSFPKTPAWEAAVYGNREKNFFSKSPPPPPQLLHNRCRQLVLGIRIVQSEIEDIGYDFFYGGGGGVRRFKEVPYDLCKISIEIPWTNWGSKQANAIVKLRLTKSLNVRCNLNEVIEKGIVCSSTSFLQGLENCYGDVFITRGFI